MAKYKCSICGYIYDEDKENKQFEDLPGDWRCPLCRAQKTAFKKIEEPIKKPDKIDIPKPSEKAEKHMDDIHFMAETGESIVAPMSTSLPIADWDDILILGAQLSTIPLEDDDKVDIQTIIGKNAKKPMVLAGPVFISHMSFGALSKETKISLAKGAAIANTAIGSGEGGILPEEKENAHKYIFEYVPNLYSVTKENLKNSDAIEIKIGQGTKPGMGGQLPGAKVTKEIAEIRGKKEGEDIHSPSHFKDIKTPSDLKRLIDNLRKESEGRPIGVKIAAGNIEEDLEFIKEAMPDFITIDGRGGATGASPKVLRDASSVPTIYALYRARKYLYENNLNIDLIITGGLRISSDFIKAIAMGADAIAIASSALIAAGCKRYKVCNTGNCPVGIATSDPELRKNLNINVASKRVGNYLNRTFEEIRMFLRITGKKKLEDLSVYDLVTSNKEISDYTNIKHC